MLGKIRKDFGLTEDSVFFEYTPSDYDRLKVQWKDEAERRKACDDWAVKTAEELLPELTIAQRAKKIGMDQKKYYKLRRKHGYSQKEKD